jgi:enoyl-CoA hydratase/carnithine racemase
MIIRGTSVTPAEAGALADAVVGSEAALGEARNVVQRLHSNAEWQRRRDTKYGALAGDSKAIEAAQGEVNGVSDASALAKRTVVDLIERTCGKDLYAGLREEAKAFGQVAGTPESMQLIAAFFAARKK